MTAGRAPTVAAERGSAAVREALQVDRRVGILVLAFVAAGWTVLAEGVSLDAYSRLNPSTVLGQAVHDAVPTVAYLVAGLVALAIRPSSRTGVWLYLAGMLQFLGNFGNTQVPGLQQLGVGSIDLYQVAIGTVVLTYPTGRFVRPAHRRLAVVAGAWLILSALIITSYLDPARCPPGRCPANPFLLIRDPDLVNTIFQVSQVIGVVLWFAFAACVLERWLHASSLARRLLRPIWVAGLLVAGSNLVSMLLATFGPEDVSATFDYWVYAMIGVALPIIFLAGLARSRLARASIADFVEEVSRGVSLGRLRDAFAHLVGDPDLVLAFPVDTSAYADADGLPVELPAAGDERVVTPIRRGGDTVAIVIHDTALETDPGLVRAAGAAAGLALENERLAAEVRARLEAVRSSRARLVEAADAERIRIERMLHDGAQQRLVALAIALRTVAGSADDSGVRARLGVLGEELDEALAELRELARGIHPSVLVQAGLHSALESLAQRSPVPVEIDVPPRRFAAAVEATAYYVTSEAITNAVRHARASRIQIAARVIGDRLDLRITDDGVGGAEPSAGSGLLGLEDRVAALGGTLLISSPHGAGTQVQVSLPLTGQVGGKP